MEPSIKAALDRIEADHEVRVLYAVESGSRAWGFASTDSDWDVRFLYLHPPDWYLSVQERRDVLEFPLTPEGLDLSGWDLKKALVLFASSNGCGPRSCTARRTRPRGACGS
jgi:predicted nucleotidyltransferase